MSSTTALVVIGGGVAGCAAAVAAADAGAAVVLLEAGRHLGGVAAIAEHRWLCGLGVLDALTAELIEPGLTAAWVEVLTTGPAARQGRTWLWPTDAGRLQSGLRQRLAESGVEVRLATPVTAVERDPATGRIQAVRSASGTLALHSLIDASGRGIAAPEANRQDASQWPAHRSVLRLPGLSLGRGERLRAMAVAQRVSGGEAALMLTPLPDGCWQLSLDVPPGTAAAAAAATANAIAAALGGELLGGARALGERDHGRPAAQLDLDELFACGERGICWAAWPREEHGAHGVTWTWPPLGRHGIPDRAVRLVDGPANCWFIGKGMPVTAAAAAALRVTGTCLALGAAIGRRAAREIASTNGI